MATCVDTVATNLQGPCVEFLILTTSIVSDTQSVDSQAVEERRAPGLVCTVPMFLPAALRNSPEARTVFLIHWNAGKSKDTPCVAESTAAETVTAAGKEGSVLPDIRLVIVVSATQCEDSALVWPTRASTLVSKVPKSDPWTVRESKSKMRAPAVAWLAGRNEDIGELNVKDSDKEPTRTPAVATTPVSVGLVPVVDLHAMAV